MDCDFELHVSHQVRNSQSVISLIHSPEEDMASQKSGNMDNIGGSRMNGPGKDSPCFKGLLKWLDLTL